MPADYVRYAAHKGHAVYKLLKSFCWLVIVSGLQTGCDRNILRAYRLYCMGFGDCLTILRAVFFFRDVVPS